MSWIQVNQTQTVEDAPAPGTIQYRLDVNVVASYGIDRELFVRSTDDDAYSHVATIGDLRGYPNNKATAQARNLDFYRATAAELIFTSQAVAAVASAQIQGRLMHVNRDWGALGGAPFGGVETFVYDSDAP